MPEKVELINLKNWKGQRKNYQKFCIWQKCSTKNLCSQENMHLWTSPSKSLESALWLASFGTVNLKRILNIENKINKYELKYIEDKIRIKKTKPIIKLNEFENEQKEIRYK